jgi:hypothetical protein
MRAAPKEAGKAARVIARKSQRFAIVIALVAVPKVAD